MGKRKYIAPPPFEGSAEEEDAILEQAGRIIWQRLAKTTGERGDDRVVIPYIGSVTMRLKVRFKYRPRGDEKASGVVSRLCGFEWNKLVRAVMVAGMKRRACPVIFRIPKGSKYVHPYTHEERELGYDRDCCCVHHDGVGHAGPHVDWTGITFENSDEPATFWSKLELYIDDRYVRPRQEKLARRTKSAEEKKIAEELKAARAKARAEKLEIAGPEVKAKEATRVTMRRLDL